MKVKEGGERRSEKGGAEESRKKRFTGIMVKGSGRKYRRRV